LPCCEGGASGGAGWFSDDAALGVPNSGSPSPGWFDTRIGVMRFLRWAVDDMGDQSIRLWSQAIEGRTRIDPDQYTPLMTSFEGLRYRAIHPHEATSQPSSQAPHAGIINSLW
jgi:hypothetical protein